MGNRPMGEKSMSPSFRNVALLYGGWSPEREVSLSTGRGVAQALQSLNQPYTLIDVQSPNPISLCQAIQEANADVIFIALHGKGHEEGSLQGVLNLLGIPYTHSGVLGSSIGFFKPLAKQIFRSLGIQTPDGSLIHIADLEAGRMSFSKRHILKPVDQGSTVGIQILNSPEDFSPTDWCFGPTALLEEFIEGREVTVGVISGMNPESARPLTTTEVLFSSPVLDYAHKYTAGLATHFTPAPLPPPATEYLLKASVKAHLGLQCRGATRCDFIYVPEEPDPQKACYLLEINTLPGLTPTSFVPEQAAALGISYADLVAYLLEHATIDS